MSFMFNAAKALLGDGFDWAGADARILLFDDAASFTPNPDTSFVDGLDPATNELDTDAYARVTLAGQAVTRVDVVNAATWDADDVVFPTLGPGSGGPTVGGAVIFLHVTNDSDSVPLIYLDDVSGTVNGTDFTIAFDPAGVVGFVDAP